LRLEAGSRRWRGAVLEDADFAHAVERGSFGQGDRVAIETRQGY
jgi:hypothetical protein